MLDGILMKCNQTPPRANNPTDCENARVAIERLAKDDVDPAVEKKRQEEFERAREKLRLAQDKLRQEQEAKTKVDAYSVAGGAGRSALPAEAGLACKDRSPGKRISRQCNFAAPRGREHPLIAARRAGFHGAPTARASRATGPHRWYRGTRATWRARSAASAR